MVLKITIDCYRDGIVTFCNYMWPEDLDTKIACPICGTDSSILNTELIPVFEGVTADGKPKEATEDESGGSVEQYTLSDYTPYMQDRLKYNPEPTSNKGVKRARKNEK